MVDLVKVGGWVDECKFGIYVVGNFFWDFKGIVSILFLGLWMISSGKFFLGFEFFVGIEEVWSLIE